MKKKVMISLSIFLLIIFIGGILHFKMANHLTPAPSLHSPKAYSIPVNPDASPITSRDYPLKPREYIRIIRISKGQE